MCRSIQGKRAIKQEADTSDNKAEEMKQITLMQDLIDTRRGKSISYHQT